MALPIQTQPAELPLPYKGPRALILSSLKRVGGLTTRDLAQSLGLSINATRHHLRELEEEGLIGFAREQRGVGAPTHTWHLTASGQALFPQRYKELLTEVLERVAAQAGRQAVVAALETRFLDLASTLRVELEHALPAERMEAVLRVLAEGGYMAEWREESGGLRLTEHNCAVRALAERFPEICEAEARFLTEVLAAAVERESHMLAGCTACEYRVRFPVPGELPVLSAGPPGPEGTS